MFESATILAVVPKARHELRGYVEEVVSQVTVAPFVPQTGVTIHTTDSEAQAAMSGAAGLFEASMLWGTNRRDPLSPTQ